MSLYGFFLYPNQQVLYLSGIVFKGGRKLLHSLQYIYLVYWTDDV